MILIWFGIASLLILLVSFPSSTTVDRHDIPIVTNLGSIVIFGDKPSWVDNISGAVVHIFNPKSNRGIPKALWITCYEPIWVKTFSSKPFETICPSEALNMFPNYLDAVVINQRGMEYDILYNLTEDQVDRAKYWYVHLYRDLEPEQIWKHNFITSGALRVFHDKLFLIHEVD